MTITRPRLRQLVIVELRKASDTRAGRWMLILLAAVALLDLILVSALGHSDDKSFTDFFYTAQLPSGFLLPVLGILSMTSEWSQRTALTTFALVPDRRRVLTAKFLGLLSLAATLVFATALGAVVATLIASLGSGGGWDSAGTALLRSLLFEGLVVLAGAGFGLALLNAPAAIVTFFILPTLLTALVSLSSALQGAVNYLDFVGNTTSLLGEDLTGSVWGKIAVSIAVWGVLPLLFGSWRAQRADIN